MPTSYQFSETTILEEGHVVSLLHIWNQEYPSQLSMHQVDELSAYLAGLGTARHVLLTDGNEQLLGWGAAFDRDGERWFAMILDHTIHRKGFGSKILSQLKSSETQLNGWVIDHDRYTRKNGQPYTSPLAFYTKNGFTVLSDIRLELDIISAVKIVWLNTTATPIQ